MWDIIANDLNMQVDPDYATTAGELIVEYPTGKKVRMGNKMKCADVRDCPIKIKCQALAGAQDDLYLIAFLNPDVPSMEKPLQRYVICTVNSCSRRIHARKPFVAFYGITFHFSFKL